MPSPEAVYRERLADRENAVERRVVLERNLSWARLAIFASAAIIAWPTLFSDTLHAAWLALPVVAFLAALAIHDRVIRARVRAERAAEFYRRGLSRIGDAWAGTGSTGERFVDPDHPYASDLDLFGSGSLFELLCSARTTVGETTLADWLRVGAPPEEIRERQDAVRELTGRIDLREDLAVLGDDVREAVDPAGLIAWSAAPPVLTQRWPVFVAPLLGIANFVSVALYFTWRFEPLIVSMLATVVFALVFFPRVRRVLGAVDRPERGLVTLSGVLARLERERFQSRLLVRSRGALDSEGDPPSVHISRLARLVEINDSRRNMMFGPIASLMLLGTQLAFAMERWRIASGPAVTRWLKAVGEFEALSSFAGYAYEHPDHPYPEIEQDAVVLEGEALGHPLLSGARVVANDVHFSDGLQLMLVSGSNMSGKSTLLRTVGVNVVVALAGGTVCAKRLRVSPLSIGACMRVQDSLQQGLSHFYAEIKRLRQVVDLSGDGRPLLFLLDEILHGTNSHDRRVGADALIRGLITQGSIGLVTTHDLALTRIADDVGTAAVNVHFADHLEGDRMIFDYRLQQGVVKKSNALDLMRAVGLDV